MNKVVLLASMAYNSLLADLSQRGLLEKTLVLVTGEFGRTPKIGRITSNNATDDSGRDHWANGFSCLVAGADSRPATSSAPATASAHTRATGRCTPMTFLPRCTTCWASTTTAG